MVNFGPWPFDEKDPKENYSSLGYLPQRDLALAVEYPWQLRYINTDITDVELYTIYYPERVTGISGYMKKVNDFCDFTLLFARKKM